MTRVSLCTCITAVIVAVALAGSAGPAPRETPTPTPTPNARESLARYAAAKRLQGQHKGESVHITDENLDRFDDGPPGDEPGAALNGVNAGRAGPAQADPRAVWRNRYSKQLAVVAEIKRDLAEVESRLPEQWEAFYACDDPAKRESEIRPALHDAIVRRTVLQGRLESERARLPEIVAAARNDGAQPGWFRDLRVPQSN